MAQCAHRNADGSSAWVLQKRIYGRSVYRCSKCGETRVI